MNKLNKAIALLSLLALLSVAVCVWESADSEAKGESESEARYIIGTSTQSYAFAKANVTVTGAIDFNKSAFGANTTFAFYYKNSDGYQSLTDLTDEFTVSGFNVKCTSVDGNGRYTVEVKATTAGSAKIIIKVVATTSVDTSFVNQEFYWGINVCLNNATIKVDSKTPSQTEATKISFEYGKNYSLSAVVYVDTASQDGYRMYAVGLPAGLAMVSKIDEAGKEEWYVSGKLATEPVLADGQFTVYAISANGDVARGTFKYSVTGKTIFDFSYDVKNGDSSLSSPYVILSSSTGLALSITNDTAFTSPAYTVLVDGSIVTATSGSYSIDISGTGTKTVTITGTCLGQTVVKTFNIYVVSQIFDSDLSPTVKSA